MGLYCEIPRDIERTFSKEGDRRFPFVTVATFGGAARPRLVGWGGRRQYSPCQTQPVKSLNFYRGTWALPARLPQYIPLYKLKQMGVLLTFRT